MDSGLPLSRIAHQSVGLEWSLKELQTETTGDQAAIQKGFLSLAVDPAVDRIGQGLEAKSMGESERLQPVMEHEQGQPVLADCQRGLSREQVPDFRIRPLVSWEQD